MLLSESELNMYNTYSILDEAVLLDESESIVKLPAIPVVENSRLGCGVVNLSDLDNIVEDYDCSYEDAFYSIAEQNEIDPDNLAVIVEDYSIIETPELVDLVPNIVVKPISENNIVYQAVDYCIDEYYETDDEGYLDYLDEISDDLIRKVAEKKLKSKPFSDEQTKAVENQLAISQKKYEQLKKAGKDKRAENLFMHAYNLKQDLKQKRAKREEFENRIKDMIARNNNTNKKFQKKTENKVNNDSKASQTSSFSHKVNNQHSSTVRNDSTTSRNNSSTIRNTSSSRNNSSSLRMITGGEIGNGASSSRRNNDSAPRMITGGEIGNGASSSRRNNDSAPRMITGGEIGNGASSSRRNSSGSGSAKSSGFSFGTSSTQNSDAKSSPTSKDNIEKSKDAANNRKEEKQHTAIVISSNPSTSNSTKHLPIVAPSSNTSSTSTTAVLKKAQSPSTSPSPNSVGSHNSFLSNHKKAIGVGTAGLVGAALVARKIAALRKQQQQHPGLRGKLQSIINKLKAKLHR